MDRLDEIIARLKEIQGAITELGMNGAQPKLGHVFRTSTDRLVVIVANHCSHEGYPWEGAVIGGGDTEWFDTDGYAEFEPEKFGRLLADLGPIPGFNGDK